jgi:uncharacterized protein
MRRAFADTYYFLALLDSTEERHGDALAAAADGELAIVTTKWVLSEFGDAYSDPKDRADFVALYRSILLDPKISIVPSDSTLFNRGIELFEARLDKKWSLTDCISFVVMNDEGIQDALTGDKHFEQAGFLALFKQR